MSDLDNNDETHEGRGRDRSDDENNVDFNDDDINNDDENNNDFNDDVDGGTSEEEDAEDEDDWDPLQVSIGGDTYDRETVTDTQVGEGVTNIPDRTELCELNLDQLANYSCIEWGDLRFGDVLSFLWLSLLR